MSISSLIPRIWLFHNFTSKCKVKVIGEVKVQRHKEGPTYYRFTPLSFCVNPPSYSCDTAFPTFDPENPRSRSWAHDVAQVQIEHFHRTSNGVNPHSYFRYMCRAMLDTNGIWFEKNFGPWANPYEHLGKWFDIKQLQVKTTPSNFVWRQSVRLFQRYAFHKVWTSLVPDLFLAHGQTHMGQMKMALYSFRSRQFHRTLNRKKNHPAVSEIFILQSLAVFHPQPVQTSPSIPLQPGRLRGEKSYILQTKLLIPCLSVSHRKLRDPPLCGTAWWIT